MSDPARVASAPQLASSLRASADGAVGVVVLVLLVAGWWPAVSAAAREPKLTILNADKEVKLTWESSGSEEKPLLSSEIHLVVANSGTKSADLTAKAFLDAADDDTDVQCTTADAVTAAFLEQRSDGRDPQEVASQTVALQSARPVVLRLTVPGACENRGATLVLDAGAGDPVEVPFTVDRQRQHEPPTVWRSGSPSGRPRFWHW